MEEINNSQIKEDSPITYTTTTIPRTKNHYNCRNQQAKSGNVKISHGNYSNKSKRRAKCNRNRKLRTPTQKTTIYHRKKRERLKWN